MKKIKVLLFAFVALFAFTLAIVKVSAEEVTFDWKADDHVVQQSDETKYSALLTNTEAFSNDIGTISFVRSGYIREDALEAATEDGENTFTYGALTEGNCDSVKNAAIKFEALKAGATIDIWYTISTSDFFNKAKVTNNVTGLSKRSGQLLVYSSEGQTLDSIPSEAMDHYNNVAYHAFYTINNANEIVYIGSGSRVVTFAFKLSQGAVAQEYTVDVMDGDTKNTSYTIADGKTIPSKPVKYGYDFIGYYTDAELTDEFAADTPITENKTLYAKFTPWTITINKNVLDTTLIDKIAESYTSFAENLPIEGTIYTICALAQMQANNHAITTQGSYSSNKEEKAVKVVVDKPGTLHVYAVNSGSTARNASLWDASGNKVAATSNSNSASWSATENKVEDARNLYYALEAGTYYFGGDNGIRIFSMEFIDADEPSVSFHQQSAYNADCVELVRYVAILEGIAETDVNGNFSLVLTGEGLGDGYDVTEFCQVATRLTSNGETYTAEINGASYEFGVKDNTLYVVCVVAVSNDGAALTNQYVGKTITATLTVNGAAVIGQALTYTILGAQA